MKSALSRAPLAGCLVIVMVLFARTGLAREKTDVVLFKNGDYLTCEIKELKRAKLKVKTDAAGTIDIEWDDIKQVTSPFTFTIETYAAATYFGQFAQPSEDGVLRVEGPGVVLEVPMTEVVGITPIESSFFSRLDGSLNFGFNFTKASGVATLSFSGNVKYVQRDYRLTLNWSSLTTTQEDRETTRRQEVSLAYLTRWSGRWFGSGMTGPQQNQDIGLELRIPLTFSVGYQFVVTNTDVLLGAVGISPNHEWYTDGGDQTSVEAPFGLLYERFRYDSPKTDLTTQLEVYPSLTIKDRVRVVYDLNVRHEVVSDLFVNVEFYYSYDSRPQSVGAAKYDYGIVTGLGWSY